MNWLLSLQAIGKLSATGKDMLALSTMNGQWPVSLPTTGFSLRTGTL